MSVSDALAWLNSTQMFGIKLGLENTVRLLEAVGNPHRRLAAFHVAGTNGKGSVCAMLDACLRASGRRCGLYTSPHLVDFAERVRVDGRMISDEGLAEGLGLLREICEGWEHSPTFFEIATVLALWWFERQECEVVVLETGMGGRLDATNVIEPVTSVLTPVAMDHAAWLGDTLSAVASEKAGIIKPGRPAVSAPQVREVVDVFEARAAVLGSPLEFVEQGWEGEIGLSGAHQRMNAAVCAAALKASRLCVDANAISVGMRSVEWPGRFQRIGDFLLDGAHNPHAAQAFAETWRSQFPGARAEIIFGCLADKDSGGILAALEPIARRFFFVPVVSARAADPHMLQQGVGVPSRVFSSLREALDATADAETKPVVVIGSLFLIGETLHALKERATLA